MKPVAQFNDEWRSTMKIRTKTTAVIALAASAALLAGCSSSPKAETPAADEPALPTQLNVTVEADENAVALLPEGFSGPLRVAIDVPNPPFELFDDKQEIIGFDPDFAHALAQKLGLEVEISQVPWDALVPSLQSDQQDVIITGMNDTVERQANLNFVDYVYGGFSILVAEGNPSGIETIYDLCGQTVAVQKSTVQGDILKEMAPECEAKGLDPVTVSELPAEEDARTAVRAGKAVADLFDSAQAKYVAENAGGGKHFDLVVDPEAPNGYFPVYSGIAILKDDQALTEAMQAALQSLIDDGTYQKLLDHHGISEYGLDEALINATK